MIRNHGPTSTKDDGIEEAQANLSALIASKRDAIDRHIDMARRFNAKGLFTQVKLHIDLARRIHKELMELLYGG